MQYWQQWHPGVQNVQRLGSALDPVRTGSKWEVQQQHWTFKMPTKYELVDYQPGKKVVVSGLSEYHTTMHQFVLMVDRHDPNWTSVRHISDVQLREWRSALQPVLGKLLASVPEEGMRNLQAILNSGSSPIYTGAFEEALRRERQHSSSRGGSTRNSGGAGARRSSGGDGSRHGNIGSIFGNFAGMFGSRDGSGSASSNGSSRSGAAVVEPPAGGQVDISDSLGFYEVLGLAVAGGGAAPGQEEIKVAYRRLAMEWHPDRHLNSDQRTKKTASERFDRIRQAYDVLKDDEKRDLYNRGLYYEETSVL